MSEEDQNVDLKLRKIACQVGDTIRGKIGEDNYNILRSQIQTKLLIKRAERKKAIAIDKISHPIQAAMRVKGIRERKKLAKRRNMDAFKSNTIAKKKRRKSDY